MQVILSSTQVRDLCRGFSRVGARTDAVRFRRVGAADAEASLVTPDEALYLALPGCASGDAGPDVFLCPFAELRRTAREMDRGGAAVLQPLAGEPSRLDIVVTINGHEVRSRTDSPASDGVPEAVPAVRAEVPAAGFLQALRRAMPFVSKEPGRATLRGVFWHDGGHAVVATDGRRLTMFPLPEVSLGADIIIPAARVLGAAVLDGDDARIGVASTGDSTVLEVVRGPWRCRVQGIEGTYPNYRMVIPADSGQFVATVQIAPEDLALVRSAVSRLTGEESEAIGLCAVPDAAPYLVSVTADPADGTRTRVELPGSRSTGTQACGQAVNGRYLLDCLEAGFLTLRLPHDCSPLLGSGGQDGVHCLMPMRDGAALVSAIARNEPETKPESEEPDAMTSDTPDTPDTAAVQTPGTTSYPPGTDAGTEAIGTPVPKLTVIGTDPLQDLRSAVAETEDALRQAAAAVRTLRDRSRAVERFLRDRDRQSTRAEKVLEQLRSAAGF